jgi:hypothetical protein
MRPLPWLRRQARALAALAVLAMLAPSLAAAAAPKPAAAAFSIVICTSEGLVTMAMGDEAPQAPASHGEREHCPACLRADPALATPMQATTPAPPARASSVAPPPMRAGAPTRAPPHARPDKTGPPAIA